MTYLLAQTGGGGGSNWLNANTLRILAFMVFMLFALLRTAIKKMSEKKAAKEAELAKLRRNDQMLRTGRTEDGTVVRMPMGGGTPTPFTQASPSSQSSGTDDARRKLQELAERRRRELAEMMRRAQQAGAATNTRPPAPPTPPTAAPPMAPRPMMRPQAPIPTAPARQSMGGTPAQMRPKSAGQSSFIPARQSTEREIRKHREDQDNKKAVKEASARRKHQETQRNQAAQAATRVQTPSVAMPDAYALPPTAESPITAGALGVKHATASKGAIGAALGRIDAGVDNNQWRRAIILSELLHRPVALRQPGEHAI